MDPTQQFDILGFGAVAVDDFVYVHAYPSPGAKVRVRERLRQCGGQTGTALVAAARLGARVAYVGVIGDDPLSLEVVQGFRVEGIDTTHSVRRPDARPAHATIIVDHAQHTRTILASVDARLGADPELPRAELIRSAAVLLVDHHGVDGTTRAVRIARESNVPVVADFERSRGDGFVELLDSVGHLIVPEQFARDVTGHSAAASAAASLWSARRSAVVVTCGDAGCWYVGGSGNSSVRSFPAYPVDVVDTTGCGDVFHGAYAVALAEGQDLPDRIAFASATAALKATENGGQTGIPTRETVEAFLEKHGRI